MVDQRHPRYRIRRGLGGHHWEVYFGHRFHGYLFVGSRLTHAEAVALVDADNKRTGRL